MDKTRANWMVWACCETRGDSEAVTTVMVLSVRGRRGKTKEEVVKYDRGGIAGARVGRMEV